MDFDSLFSSHRWRILEILARNPSSPLEIAKNVNTSVAYVSQQLKLLEVAGLIQKQKTGAAEKGKPRTLFSISQEIFYITALIKNFPAKKIFHLNDYRKVILRIWLLDNPDLHYYIEKFYWAIENDLKDVKAIFFDTLKSRLIVMSDSKKIRQKAGSFFASKKKIECSILPLSEIKRISYAGLIPIYDPESIFAGHKELKGGINE
jgi:predicted transcriptional regulator